MGKVERGWQPEQTWLFVVGTLEWKYPDMFGPFPEKERRDAKLVRFFREAGVPDGQIVYLQDQKATLRQIERTLVSHVASASEDALLFLYYCGHGYRADGGDAYFASYDAGDEGVTGWSVKTIPALLEEHFPGKRVLAAIDCCCSGSLAHAMRRQAKRLSYACLSSSLANQASTGNWTFTEALLAALQGEAYSDSDQSEHVTLAELAQLIADDMSFVEEQQATFVTTGDFDPHMVLAPARRRADARVGERVEVLSDGTWYKARIVGASGGRYRVHYYGWDEADDEWVGPEQLREGRPTQYPVGARVEVQSKRTWYPATILQVKGGSHLVHYEGYSDDWDEWVPSKRIRPLTD